jgi:hypothetical protein
LCITDGNKRLFFERHANFESAWYELINTYAPLRAKYLPQSVLELRRAITESYASQLEAHLQAAIDHFHSLTMLLSS